MRLALLLAGFALGWFAGVSAYLRAEDRRRDALDAAKCSLRARARMRFTNYPY